MRDYQADVEYFLANPEEITPSWGSPLRVRPHDHGKLFQFCSPTGDNEDTPAHQECGCLTMIRNSDTYHAWTPALTAEIHADRQLPTAVDRTTARSQLERMARWQERLDYEIRGVPLGHDQYQCAACKFIFTKGRSDEEALKESRRLWGDQPAGTLALVCEDCFRRGDSE